MTCLTIRRSSSSSLLSGSRRHLPLAVIAQPQRSSIFILFSKEYLRILMYSILEYVYVRTLSPTRRIESPSSREIFYYT